METTNLIIFYFISIIAVAGIPAVIEVLKELKQWKVSYDRKKRLAKFIDELYKSINT